MPTLNLVLEKDMNSVKKVGLSRWLGRYLQRVFTERLLLNFEDLKVVLNRNVDEFCIMSSLADANQKVKLIDAHLNIRKVNFHLTYQPKHFSGS